MPCAKSVSEVKHVGVRVGLWLKMISIFPGKGGGLNELNLV